MRLRPYLFCLALASLSLLACSSEPTTATAVVRPQLVAVNPADFLGGRRCALPLDLDAGAGGGDAGTNEGMNAVIPCRPDLDPDTDPEAVRSYVATLFDVTPDADGVVPNPGAALASSAPAPCIIPVTFSFVVAGRRYLAEVDAYYERPECLTPISPGSRLLSDPNGARAVPRWAATCGGYPPSPDVEAGTGSAGAEGVTDADAGACENRQRPPGVISYAAITQTPHDCGCGLQAP